MVGDTLYLSGGKYSSVYFYTVSYYLFGFYDRYGSYTYFVLTLRIAQIFWYKITQNKFREGIMKIRNIAIQKIKEFEYYLMYEEAVLLYYDCKRY